MTKFARWYPAESCTGSARPGARALMRFVLDEFPKAANWGIYNCRNARGTSTTSPHGEGRAIDVGFPLSGGQGSSYGYALVNALLKAGPHKLGIQAIIYDRKIWSARSPGGRRYTGAHPHYDHVHVEMTRSAANSVTLATVRAVIDGNTSGGGSSSGGIDYEDRVDADPGERTLSVGKVGTDVQFVQAFIGKSKAGKADGYFGPNTEAGVKWYQHMRGITVDGIVGPVTWSHILGHGDPDKPKSKPLDGKTVDYSNLRMAAQNAWKDGGDSSVENVQRALNHEFGTGLEIDGIFGRKTRRQYSRWQHRLGYRGDDADGIPGSKSLHALGDKYGFRVTT